MISIIGNKKCTDPIYMPTKSRNIESFLSQESLKGRAMFQDKVKSAKIIALQRRFSSCGNLGWQLNSSEGDLVSSSTNQITAIRSSSFPKAPHYISSLYHSVDGNNSILNPSFVHGSSVELPSPTSSSKRLRSGSCPQVWTSVKFSGQVSMHNNLLGSNNQNSSALVLNETRNLTNIRKNSVPCFQRLHAVNFLHEKCGELSDENKLKCKKSQDVSFGSTDSSLAAERNENIYSDTFSSYEDLYDEPKFRNECESNVRPHLSNFSLISSLKRTASTECFSLPCESANKCDFPCQVGLQKFVRNSFFSNSDIYNLKSPVETKPILSNFPQRIPRLVDSQNTIKFQDKNVIHSRKEPNLTKTVSDQHLSSPKMCNLGQPIDLNEEISRCNIFNKRHLNSSNKNSVYVSSVFLNLSNSQRSKNKSNIYSAPQPEKCSFSEHPSTYLHQTSNSRSRLPGSVSPYSNKIQSPTILTAQKETFDMLLTTVKEAINHKDSLKNDVKHLESTLIQNRQVLHRMEVCPIFVQELKKDNFVLKSEILRLMQFLGPQPKGDMTSNNDDDDGRDHFLLDLYNNQKWSYNPSYNGRH